MKKITKALAASALIGGAVFAVPAVANAATYTPGATATATATATPGGAFALAFAAGDFVPGSTLTITLSSTGPVPTDATAAVFHAATATASGTANSQGGTTVTGTVPANATGNIVVTATDPAGNSAVGTIYVTAASTTTTTTATTSTTGLATTGTYISLATVWGAVGLVALGGGAIAVRQIGRKREQSNNA